MKLDELPAPGEFWKAPEPKPRGDADVREIYASVGQFLTTWEQLEHIFSFLFQRFVEGSHAATLAYGSIISNGGRRDALLAAADGYFIMERPARDDLRSRIKKLIGHFQNACCRRNEIAHGTAVRIEHDGEPLGHFVVPPWYNSRKREAIPKPSPDPLSIHGDYRYTSADIQELISRLNTFSAATHEYANHGWDWDIQFRMRNRGSR